MVIHDEVLERTTTGKGPVNDLNLDELKAFDAGSWFAPGYKGAVIPTLEEVLTTYKDSFQLFDIELKNRFTAYPGLEEAVLEQVVRHGLEERVIISSFNAGSLLSCRRLNPSVRTGLIYLEEIKEPWHYINSLGCYSAHPLFFYLQDPETMAGFKTHNTPLYPWTVNDPEQMSYLVAEGVEAIITDFPQELVKHLG